MSKAQNEMPDLGIEYQIKLMHELAEAQRQVKMLQGELSKYQPDWDTAPEWAIAMVIQIYWTDSLEFIDGFPSEWCVIEWIENSKVKCS